MPKNPTSIHDEETEIRPALHEQGDPTELFGEGEPRELDHLFGVDGVYGSPAHSPTEPAAKESSAKGPSSAN